MCLYPKIIDRFFSHTFVRYCFIGGVNGVVTYSLIFILMVFFNLNYLVSNVLGYAAGITTSFLLNKYANFKSDGKVRIELPIFVFSFLIAYSVNIVVLYALVEWLFQSQLTGLIIASATYSVLFYLASRFFVFINRSSGTISMDKSLK
jgi:putative flippase GtrA